MTTVLNSFSFFAYNSKSDLIINKSFCYERVSAKLTLSENLRNLEFLKNFTIGSEMPVSEQEAYKKFIISQEDYFNELYPSKYYAAKTLLGWKKIHSFDSNGEQIEFYCPKRFEKTIMFEWRYESGKKLAFKGVIAGQEVKNFIRQVFFTPNENVKYCFDDGLTFSDYYQANVIPCPYIKGKELFKEFFECSEIPVSEERYETNLAH